MTFHSGTLLILLLTVAAAFDFYRQIIPNSLVLLGIILSFSLALFSLDPALTPISAVLGFLLGLVLFLPFYLFGKIGAGDVKLMGMAGSFVGPLAICWGALFSLIAGGVLAVMWVAAGHFLPGKKIRHQSPNGLREVDQKNADTVIDEEKSLSTHPRRMPFAAAIAVGCSLAYLGFRQ